MHYKADSEYKASMTKGTRMWCCRSKLFGLVSLSSLTGRLASRRDPSRAATAGTVVSFCIHDGSLVPPAPASIGSPDSDVDIVPDAAFVSPPPPSLSPLFSPLTRYHHDRIHAQEHLALVAQ